MVRYSVIEKKNRREIVLLRGSGCKWRKCRFCDYHLDFCTDEAENFELNKAVLENVTGCFEKLEIINSGSFCDLDEKIFERITELCAQKGIKELFFEAHWIDRDKISMLRERFSKQGIKVNVKIGVETFDRAFRESYLKGIDTDSAAGIAKYFDECCLLFGLPGQTEESMRLDIETGLRYFKRVCINLMQENSTQVKPDKKVIGIFTKKLLPVYADEERIDILMENTDFGIGGSDEQ